VSFLLILYIKSTAENNQSGGFNQEYYDESYKRGDKKAKVRLALAGAAQPVQQRRRFSPFPSAYLGLILTRPDSNTPHRPCSSQ
jgi:hypothetical protein